MYDQLHISGFRGIRDLALRDLRRINIFVGANNAGKTSILEAVWLLRAPGNPALILTIAQFRGVNVVNQFGASTVTPALLWRNLFHRTAEPQAIVIEGSESGRQERLSVRALTSAAGQLRPAVGVQLGRNGTEASPSPAASDFPLSESLEYSYARGDDEPVRTTVEYLDGRISFSVNPAITQPLSIYLSSRRWPSEQELAENFSRLEELGSLDLLMEAIRQLDNRIHALSLGFVDGRPVIRGHVDGAQLIPLYFLGDGAVHLTNFVVSISAARDGLVAIDEVENGIYHENLVPMWRTIDRASRGSAAQIFATTHSSECLQAAIEAFSGEGEDAVRIHRLERRNGAHVAVSYDLATAREAFAIELEVR